VYNTRGDDDDDDDSKSYVHPLLQLETVTSVLVIRSDKQFSFQITTAQLQTRQNKTLSDNLPHLNKVIPTKDPNACSLDPEH